MSEAVTKTTAATPSSSHSGPSSAVKITIVKDKKDLDRFIKLPWKIYEGNPAWVPPLLHDVNILFDRNKHPFHQHGTVEYFLAWKKGEVVGRIAAIVNHLSNEFHGDRIGFFGFFESINDVAVSRALFAAVEEWLFAKGMDTVRGPMNFSTNEECALLVDAFDKPPVLMMTFNPNYYPRLVEDAGYGKSKDLLAYYRNEPTIPEPLRRRTEKARLKMDFTIREADIKHFDKEVAIMKALYNSAWEKNWGFVPMTDAEFDFMAKQLKPVVEPKLILIAEVQGKPVGFAIALPDFNVPLKHMNGKLFPFGVLKMLWYKRKIRLGRVITLGLIPEYRRSGIDVFLYLKLYENGFLIGLREMEASWILDDNWEMRRGIERFGGYVYKTYRVYDKPLTASE